MFNFGKQRAAEAEQLARAEARIKELEYLVEAQPDFREVALEFDVSSIIEPLLEHVLDEFTPFIERDAIKLLKHVFANVKNSTGYNMAPIATAYIAEERASRTYELEVVIERMGARFRVATGFQPWK